MGSSYFGERTLGNERSGNSSSSRKGKKNNSDHNKPKQPQRGLGVAQLEKIRLQSQLGCSYFPSLHAPYPLNPNQEDIRIYSPVPSSSPPSPSFSYASSPSSTYGFLSQQSIMIGLGELEGGNIRFGDSQPTTTARWNPCNDMLETQQFAHPGMASHFLDLQVEDAQKKRRKDRNGSVVSSSQKLETSDTQDQLNLELKLSL